MYVQLSGMILFVVLSIKWYIKHEKIISVHLNNVYDIIMSLHIKRVS